MNDTPEKTEGTEVQVWEETRLPWHPALEERLSASKLSRRDWKTICEVIFPSATEVNSIVMALDYCRARNLDVMKRMAHIVPVWNSKARKMVDTIWPSIAELRTTAMRTKDYAGTDRIEFGPMVEKTFTGTLTKWRNGQGTDYEAEATVTFPEWAQMTVYRIVHGQRVAFCPPPVYWEETYGIQGKHGQSEIPNSMWQRRVRGQLAKCCEAAALRFTFPEELGNDYAAEEMEGQQFYGADNAKVVNDTRTDSPASPPPTEAAKEPEAEVIEEAPESPVEGVTDQPDETPEQEEQAPSEQPDKEEQAKTPDRTRSGVYAELMEKAETFSDFDELAAWDEQIDSDVEWIGEEFPDSAAKINQFILDQLAILSTPV